jgi:hypothetical protein
MFTRIRDGTNPKNAACTDEKCSKNPGGPAPHLLMSLPLLPHDTVSLLRFKPGSTVGGLEKSIGTAYFIPHVLLLLSDVQQ